MNRQSWPAILLDAVYLLLLVVAFILLPWCGHQACDDEAADEESRMKRRCRYEKPVFRRARGIGSVLAGIVERWSMGPGYH